MRRVAFILLVALLPGCRQILGLDEASVRGDTESSGPDDDATTGGGTTTDESSSSASGESGTGGDDCLLLGGAPAQFLPPFTSPFQEVDGSDADFCGVPSVAWRHGDGGFESLATAADADAIVRVAWSTAALHVHAWIGDDDVRPNEERPYLGDAFEVFVSSTDELEGEFDGAEAAGSVQLVVAPGQTGPIVELYPDDAQPLEGVQATALSVADGYVVEMFIPWRWPERITIDSRIGFDVALDSATGESAFSQALLCLEPVETTSCASMDPHPSCDNRTWCRPRLDRG